MLLQHVHKIITPQLLQHKNCETFADALNWYYCNQLQLQSLGGVVCHKSSEEIFQGPSILSLVYNMTLASQVSRKKYLYHQSNYIPDIKFFDNLIGWMLANAGDATLEQKSSLFQHHPDSCKATLVPVSYCETGFNRKSMNCCLHSSLDVANHTGSV